MRRGSRKVLLPIIAVLAIIATDLLVAFVYEAIVGDSFYHTVVHTDRGRNRKYRTRSPAYHHDLAKNLSLPASWGDPYFVHTNSLGFRDREVRDVVLDPEQPRVVVLGDSFVEGVRVDYDGTLVGLLATHLEPEGVEVLNAGVSSYAPTIYERKVRYLTFPRSRWTIDDGMYQRFGKRELRRMQDRMDALADQLGDRLTPRGGSRSPEDASPRTP